MARSQDIHIQDNTLWETFRTQWQNADYTSALTTLQNSQLDSKYFGADVINYMTGWLTTVQNLNDPTWKDDLIQTSSTAPSTLSTGEVYFSIL